VGQTDRQTKRQRDREVERPSGISFLEREKGDIKRNVRLVQVKLVLVILSKICTEWKKAGNLLLVKIEIYKNKNIKNAFFGQNL
jgi:hypothetical protein